VEDGAGKIALTVRYGSKTIEFEKGKVAIMWPNKRALIQTLHMVIAAVRAGELDEILAQQTKARVMPRGKRSIVRMGWLWPTVWGLGPGHFCRMSWDRRELLKT
jgi:hypothetical protein